MVDPSEILKWATHSWSRENGWLVSIPGAVAVELDLTEHDCFRYELPAWRLENVLDRFRV